MMVLPYPLATKMDPTDTVVITIGTHNVNGFARNKQFLRSQCDHNPNSIRAYQEHWLKPPYKKINGVNQLRNLHADFDGFGTSAMKKAVDSQIIKGRPYGGTGFIYNKKFSKSLKPLLDFSHERVTAMRLDTASHPILLINVYFPYYNSRDIETHMSLYRDTIGFVENVIMQNPDCKTMILADLNCNLFDVRHPYTKLVREMMNRHNLISCFDTVENFDKQSSYTRYDVKTGSYTLIDGILISDDLIFAVMI